MRNTRGGLFVLIGFIVLFLDYHAAELAGIPHWAILLCYVVFMGVAQVVARFLGVGGLAGLGLQKQPGRSRHLWLGFAVGFGFYLLAMLVAYGQGQVRFQGNFSVGAFLILLGMIVLTFFSSAAEDLLTRGFVFRFLGERFTTPVLVLLSSVLYVLNHIWRIKDGYTQWLFLLLFGIALAIPLARTGMLWFTIGCHWGWNTLSLFKDSIGDNSSFKVIDGTSDWLYIVTMVCLCGFVAWFSGFLQRESPAFSSGFYITSMKK